MQVLRVTDPCAATHTPTPHPHTAQRSRSQHTARRRTDGHDRVGGVALVLREEEGAVKDLGHLGQVVHDDPAGVLEAHPVARADEVLLCPHHLRIGEDRADARRKASVITISSIRLSLVGAQVD